VYTGQIQEALTGAIDTTKLAEAWQALHPAEVSKVVVAANHPAPVGLRGGEVAGFESRPGRKVPVAQGKSAPPLTKAISPLLSQFLDRASRAITRALTAVLAKLYTEGWVLGQRSAQALVNGGQVDWGAWKPGDHRAAAAIAGPGLKQLLDSAGIRIKSIAATRLQDLADVLEATLASDVTHRQPLPAPLEPSLSVGDLARQLRDVLDKPERAELVAQAEIGRAQATASRQVYRETGVAEIEISTAEDDKVCPVCDAAEEVGAHPLGTEPMVLLHPRCRCAELPVLVGA
jgi:hypothetical protein